MVSATVHSSMHITGRLLLLTNGTVHRVLLCGLRRQDDAGLVALLHIDLGLPGALRLQDAGALPPLSLSLMAKSG